MKKLMNVVKKATVKVSANMTMADKFFLASTTLIGGTTLMVKACNKFDKQVIAPVIAKRSERVAKIYVSLSDLSAAATCKTLGVAQLGVTFWHMHETIKDYKRESLIRQIKTANK